MAAQPLVCRWARMAETAMSGRQRGALRGAAPARRSHCPRGLAAAAAASMSMAAARPRAPVPGHRMAGGRACGAAAGLPRDDRPASPSRARAVARRRPASGWDRVLPDAVAARLRVPLHRAGPAPVRGWQAWPDPIEGPASTWRRSWCRSGRPAARIQAPACCRLQAMASLSAPGGRARGCLVMLRSAGAAMVPAEPASIGAVSIGMVSIGRGPVGMAQPGVRQAGVRQAGVRQAGPMVPAPAQPGRGGAPLPPPSVRAWGPAVPPTAG